jgi:hypothetical protein
MRLGSRLFVSVAFAFVVAGCGGSGPGSAPTGSAVARRACALPPLRHAVLTCRSPDGLWLVSQPGKYGICSLVFENRHSGKRVRFKSPTGCSESATWVKPHLFVLGGDVLAVSFDPSIRKVRVLAQLADFRVSPDGRWIAGPGPGQAREAVTVYVRSIRGRDCLVVPGRSVDIAGFTPNSENAIVIRSEAGGRKELRQFALSSLRPGCPKGPTGVLIKQSSVLG